MSNYLSVAEWCEKYGKDPGNTRRLLAAGRLPGIKIGKQWVIPEGVEPPSDRRVKSGKYRDWRKPKKNQKNDPQ